MKSLCLSLALLVCATSALAGPTLINLTPVSTTGDGEDALVLFAEEATIENRSVVTTAGTSADGLRVAGDRGRLINAAGAEIRTSGDFFAVGMRARGDQLFFQNDGTIITTGINGDGMVVFGGFGAGTVGSEVVNNGSITVNGVGADTFVVEGDNTTITNTGEMINNGGVDPSNNDNATGVFLAGASNYLINDGGTIRTTGTDSTTVRVFTGGSVVNSGLIENSGDRSGTSPSITAGVALTAFGQDVVVRNSGTIRGDVIGGSGDQTLILETGSVIDGRVNVGLFDNPAADNDVLRADTDASIELDGNDYVGFETFSKAGSGDLFTSGTLDLTTTGQATIEEGRLLLNPLARLEAERLTIKDGGTLGGFGTVIGDMDVQAGGAISPGFSPGILNVDGDLILNGGFLIIEVAGLGPTQIDLIDVTGIADLLAGEVLFEFIDGFLPSAGDAFSFIEAMGGLSIDPSVTFSYSGAAAGFEFRVAGGSEGLSFVALNDAVAVSEPATLALLLAGLILTLRQQSALKVLRS